MAKLYELHREGDFDVIVLDTPPSRNALDFLDAPDRLTGFLEGKALRAFLAPTGLAAKIVGRGTSVVLSALKRVTGVELLEDLSTFFGSLSGLLAGFRERAKGVKALLADPATTFLIVASPEHEPVEEAIFFGKQLRDAGLPFGGLIVNRAHAPVLGEVPAGLPEDLALRVRLSAAELDALADRDAAAITRLQDELGVERATVIPHLPDDVHDVDGLVVIQRYLFSGVRG